MNRLVYTICHQESADRKLKDGPFTYLGGRGNWVWATPHAAEDFLLAGYTGPDGKFHDLSGLAVYTLILPNSWEEDVEPSDKFDYHVLLNTGWVHWRYQS